MIAFEWHLLIPIVLTLLCIYGIVRLEKNEPASEWITVSYTPLLQIILIVVILIVWITYGGFVWW